MYRSPDNSVPSWHRPETEACNALSIARFELLDTIGWRRALTSRAASVLKTLFQRWGYVAASQILAPIGWIQEFKAQPAAGTFRGYGYAVFYVVVTIIMSLALWIFAVIVPLIFAAITYHEVFG